MKHFITSGPDLGLYNMLRPIGLNSQSKEEGKYYSYCTHLVKLDDKMPVPLPVRRQNKLRLICTLILALSD